MHAITLFFQVFGLDSSGIADEEDLCRYTSGYPGSFSGLGTPPPGHIYHSPVLLGSRARSHRELPVRRYLPTYPRWRRQFIRFGHSRHSPVLLGSRARSHQELPVRRYLPTYPCVPGIFPDWVFRWQPRIPFPCSFGFPGSLSSGIADKEISADIPPVSPAVYPVWAFTPSPCSAWFTGWPSPGITGKGISAAILPVSRSSAGHAQHLPILPGSLVGSRRELPHPPGSGSFPVHNWQRSR